MLARFQTAGAPHLALFEVLLTEDPDLGALLWRALGDALHTRYTGAGRVDERTLMLFRAPANPQVQTLRTSQLDLDQANTDDRLLDFAVAAIAHGQDEWLNETIEKDRAARHAWRRRRGTFLSGFLTGATLPVAEAELEGTAHSQEQDRLADAARRRARDAAARHLVAHIRRCPQCRGRAGYMDVVPSLRRSSGARLAQ